VVVRGSSVVVRGSSEALRGSSVALRGSSVVIRGSSEALRGSPEAHHLAIAKCTQRREHIAVALGHSGARLDAAGAHPVIAMRLEPV